MLGPGKYIVRASDILHEQAIYYTSEQYIAWRQNIGQILSNLAKFAQGTVVTVGQQFWR